MSKSSTTFAGLQLRNPVIISSSGLTDSAKKNRELYNAGAGAIVLKSLFEEQIIMQSATMATNDSPEAEDYLRNYVRSHSINEYIQLIKDSKKECPIPIIASINCFNMGEWVTFAKMIQEAGADAIELNVMSLATSKEYKYGAIEQNYIDILAGVKANVSIPLIVKLSANLSNPIALINQLYANGAAGVVMFNRFYQPDINIKTMEYTKGDVLGNGSELSSSLRWTAISSAQIQNISYAISGGVNSGAALVKALLAGASAVEVCSVLYQQGNAIIDTMNNELSEWMMYKGYSKISEFMGKMNSQYKGDANPFERTQFMKYFSNR